MVRVQAPQEEPGGDKNWTKRLKDLRSERARSRLQLRLLLWLSGVEGVWEGR
jgi:hypothetical protein